MGLFGFLDVGCFFLMHLGLVVFCWVSYGKAEINLGMLCAVG